MTAVHPRRRLFLGVGAVVLVALLAVGLAVFQPWKLVVDRSVDQASPTLTAGTMVLAHGELISHEHSSSGTVLVLELPDGSRVLRLEDLDTSDGPLLRVWLTDAPVIAGTDGWHVFDDGAVVDLGDLAGNVGSSNYPIPAGTDLSRLTSVSIWCDRFDVSFAAAQLVPRQPATR